MNEQMALQIAANAMVTAAKLAAPIVLGAMAVGILVSLFQTVTQLQEPTLTFVPKLLVVGLVLTLAGHWMLSTCIGYVDNLFQSLPQLLGG